MNEINHPYVVLARKVIEEYIKNESVIEIPNNFKVEDYQRKAGVFVTLYKNKTLRGCIGTFLPTQANILEEIRENSIAACSRDYRFEKLTISELDNLTIEVSLLTQPKMVEKVELLDPKKDGIIVLTLDGRSGLLLPDIEGVDTVEKQIEIASQKGGIDFKKDNPELYTFQVEKYC